MQSEKQDQKTARDRLHHIIDIVDDERVNAMLTLFQDFEEDQFSYTDKFVAELDKEYDEYQNGGKTFSKEEVGFHTSELLKSIREKK
jgi:hypothetical protein